MNICSFVHPFDVGTGVVGRVGAVESGQERDLGKDYRQDPVFRDLPESPERLDCQWFLGRRVRKGVVGSGVTDWEGSGTSVSDFYGRGAPVVWSGRGGTSGGTGDRRPIRQDERAQTQESKLQVRLTLHPRSPETPSPVVSPVPLGSVLVAPPTQSGGSGP